MRRVVITGMGIVSPIGNSVEEFTEALKEGRNGITMLPDELQNGLKVHVAALVKDFNLPESIPQKDVRRYDIYTLYAMKAAEEAMAAAGLDRDSLKESYDPCRCGVYAGSGIGGITTFLENIRIMEEKGPRRISPYLIPSMISNMAAGIIAMQFGLKGPSLPIVTACATSTNTIGEAFRNIRDGYSDLIVAGGSESAVNQMTLGGFANLQALYTGYDPHRASIPFSKDRRGFVMGEGAGILVLEEYESAMNRGAAILCEIAGYGNTQDAHHMTAPEPQGEGAARAMEEALKDVGKEHVDPQRFWYNAHGTSTKLNDLMETEALKSVFKDNAGSIRVSSVKSMTGHTLGAAGAIEAIASVIAINNDFIPPTINIGEKDEEIVTSVIGEKALCQEVDMSLSSSFGFGGHNAAILLRKVR